MPVPRERVPRHLAVIMDGNGRWAIQRGMGRPRGHREGAKRLDDIVTECCKLGIRYLTVFAFSTENWKRPVYEVNLLWRLFVLELRKRDKKLHRNGVKFTCQGEIERLPHFLQAELKRVARVTETEAPRLVMNVSVSYGGRQEIIYAVKKVAEKVKAGELNAEDINEDVFRQFLFQPEIPDPDLLIRTGGDSRISNFLLWEIAYTELFITDTLWPDFSPAHLHRAILDYGQRERRFGMTSAQVQKPSENTPEIRL